MQMQKNIELYKEKKKMLSMYRRLQNLKVEKLEKLRCKKTTSKKKL